MINVDEARERVLATIDPTSQIAMPLLDALGLALAEDVRSEIDLPPFTNSAMDGFAVRSDDLRHASMEQPIRLKVIGRMLAGETAAITATPGTTLRIMTGAAVPAAFDAVIPFEEVAQIGPDEIVVSHPVAAGANIRPHGEDLRAGDLLVQPGETLTPVRIGLLAAAGIEQVRVHPRPKVAILSTGDELVAAPGDPLRPARIHDSNGPMLAALVQQAGGEVTGMSRIADDLPALHRWLENLEHVDLIISSGGISAGDSDHIRDLLASNLQLEFWQVAMKPGKPLAFGRAGKTAWIALPGNPVAAAVAFWQFGHPALRKLGGHRHLDLPTVSVTLQDRIENRGGRSAFIRARVEFTVEGAIAAPTGKSGSAMLGSLALANALVIVPESLEVAEPGTQLLAQLIDWPGQGNLGRERS
jgi:molybdopterin molybdotransferase